MGWKVIMGFTWWFIKRNRTTSNLSGFDFCKCEGMMATGQRDMCLIDFNGTTQLFEVKYGIYQLQTLKRTVRACSAVRGAQGAFFDPCLNALCLSGNTFCNCRSAALLGGRAGPCQTVRPRSFVFVCVYKYKPR